MTEEIGSTSEQLPPVQENRKEMADEVPPSFGSSSSESAPNLSDAVKYFGTLEYEDIRPFERSLSSETSDPGAKSGPNLPTESLLTDRADYIKIGIPLYEASIKCDWEAAKAIIEKKPDLVRYSITEKGETALHVAASAKVPQKMGEVFVKNLVNLMERKDLALENKNYNTALYLAVAAGNLETVQIMVEKNRDLVTIPGAGKRMLPLYVAALFGKNDLVRYLFKHSINLCESGWTDQNRGWLLEKCVENDMFDIALEIVKKYPKLGRNVLPILARKPEVLFPETFTIKGGVFTLGKYIYSAVFSTNQPSENIHQEPGSGSVPVENLNQKPEASSKKSSNILWRTINSGKRLYSAVFRTNQPFEYKHPEAGSGSVPVENLNQKPEASSRKSSNILWRTINSGKHLYSAVFRRNQPFENKHPEAGSGSVPIENFVQKPEASSKKSSNILWRTINSGKHLYSAVFRTNQPFENKHLEAGSGSSVPVENLNQKPEASSKISSNILWRTINSAFAFDCSKVKAPENRRIALQLLRFTWDDIAKMPRNEIDDILTGPPDSHKQDKSAPGRAILVMQLQDLISEHLYKMNILNQNIIKAQKDLTEKGTNPVSGETDQSFDLINPISSGETDQSFDLINPISKSLVSLHVETQKIIRGSQDSINQDNKPMSGKADKGLELQKLISENILNTRYKIHEMSTMGCKEALILQRLQDVISNHIQEMKTETQKIISRPAYSSRVLFIAAKMGNTKFLVELIRLYPDIIWKVNDNNQTIFHIAVRYRHAGIYNLLYEIGAMKDLITPLRDPKGNNMLHLVGMSAKREQLEDVPGVALQMQRELLWFQEVEKMIPPSYREQKNEDGLTPHELFTKEHQEMVTEGEKWMKKIASQCIVVAALIATMVFAAAFTVPGGYNQSNGIPIFHSKLSFQIFVVADAISLFLSTASILHMFLSVFTSHYAEGDFLVTLPKKLTIGLTFLFYSIASMLIAFCSGFFVLYHKGLLWMPILISVFALLPFFLSVKLNLFAFFKVIVWTSSSSHLFKPKKRVLYYENPKV